MLEILIRHATSLLPPVRHLSELDRLVAAAGLAHVAARRALAAAIAEETREAARRAALAARAVDLESARTERLLREA